MQLLLVYLVIINALGFTLMHIDKYKAKKNLWRIPEKALLTVACIGGSIGCLLGMQTARHKTKHLQFSLGLPIILALQIILVIVLLPHFL